MCAIKLTRLTFAFVWFIAIRIIHGDRDRATSHKATMEFFERINSPEKELKIYEGYEHVMMKASRSSYACSEKHV